MPEPEVEKTEVQPMVPRGSWKGFSLVIPNNAVGDIGLHRLGLPDQQHLGLVWVRKDRKQEAWGFSQPNSLPVQHYVLAFSVARLLYQNDQSLLLLVDWQVPGLTGPESDWGDHHASGL